MALISICTVVELVLQAGDMGLLPVSRLRAIAYEYFGFWPGLLDNWRPNFPAQPWTMFLTYGFLHGGIIHLALNMITLFSLSRLVVDRVGSWRFSVLYAASILGGAAGYATLNDSFTPMVGASGALFGLAGAIVSWDYVDRFTIKVGLWPVLRAVLLLIALNIALWWAMDGLLAWQTHLGGFVTGWIVALLLDPTGRAGPEDTASS